MWCGSHINLYIKKDKSFIALIAFIILMVSSKKNLLVDKLSNSKYRATLNLFHHWQESSNTLKLYF